MSASTTPGQPGIILGSHQIDAERRSLFFFFSLQQQVPQHAVCAGLVGRSFVGFESVGWFGYYGFPTSARPWQNQTLWNWSQKCNSNIQTNWYCGILYAIFGYQVCNDFPFLCDSHMQIFAASLMAYSCHLSLDEICTLHMHAGFKALRLFHCCCVSVAASFFRHLHQPSVCMLPLVRTP